METDTFTAPDDFGFSLSQPELTLILIGAALLRALPLLIAASAILKLRRFPTLRPLHILLLLSTLLIATLGLIDTTAPNAIPMTLRTSGLWSFLWIFAIAWLVITWVRSAIKTRLRPRVLDIATLATLAALALALLIPLTVGL